MLQLISRLLSRNQDLLIELKQDLVKVKPFGGEKIFADAPYIAVEKSAGKHTVLAIGIKAKDLKAENVIVINPFSHPRSFVADFTHAEKIIQHAIRQVLNSKLPLAPRVVMHQLEKNEGGLTEVEARVLLEIARGAGAREVLLYSGKNIDTTLETYDSIRKKTSEREE